MTDGKRTKLEAHELLEVRGHVYRVAGFNAYGQPMLDLVSWPLDGERQRAEKAATPPRVLVGVLDEYLTIWAGEPGASDRIGDGITRADDETVCLWLGEVPADEEAVAPRSEFGI